MNLADRLREEAETLARSMQKDLVEAALEKQKIEYGEAELLDRSRLRALEMRSNFASQPANAWQITILNYTSLRLTAHIAG